MAEHLRERRSAGFKLANKLRMIKIDFEADGCTPVCRGDTVSHIVHADIATTNSALIQRLAKGQDGGSIITVHIDMQQFQGAYGGTEDLFGAYMGWLYKHRLETEDPHDGEYYRLLDLYHLGIYLEDTFLQHAVLDAIAARNKSPKTPFAAYRHAHTLVSRCYNGAIPADLKVKSLLVTLFAEKATSKDVGDITKRGWPAGFLEEVAARLVPNIGALEARKKLLELRERLE